MSNIYNYIGEKDIKMRKLEPNCKDCEYYTPSTKIARETFTWDWCSKWSIRNPTLAKYCKYWEIQEDFIKREEFCLI